MSKHTNHQIIYEGDNPKFAVIPYDEYLATFSKDTSGEQGKYPFAVVKKMHLENKPPVRAWREYLGRTQTDMAEALDITQAGYSQIEQTDNPRDNTLDKIAKIFEIDVELLK